MRFGVLDEGILNQILEEIIIIPLGKEYIILKDTRFLLVKVMVDFHTSKRDSVKLRRLLFREKEIETEALGEDEEKGKYKFHVLKMSFDQGLSVIDKVRNEIKEDEFLSKVKIREFDPKTDSAAFVRVYNRAFITAPDPYRSLSLGDVEHFNPKSTFVAVLYGQLIGFIFLTIEPLIKQGVEVGKQGVIAGIGVDPRYRRKKIALLLATRAAEYVTEQ